MKPIGCIDEQFEVPTSVTRELLQSLYWEKELDQRQIARRLGRAQSLISNLMKIHQIPTRRPPNFKGHRHSEESKKKISEAKQGRIPWNKSLKGAYHLSEDTKRKISVAVSEALKGHEVSEETRRKISESKKGKPAWNKGKKRMRELSSDFKEEHTPWNKGKESAITPHITERKEDLLEESRNEIKPTLNEVPRNKEWKRWWKSSTEFKKGHIPWNRGLKGVMKAWNKGKKENLSEESRMKIVLAHKDKPSWNKGKNPYLERPETIKKIKEARLKQIFPVRDTSIEIAMQEELKRRSIPFRTHYPIVGQPDIFIEPNICIFCDGDYWHTLPDVKARDEKITRLLQEKGHRVLRFSENEILNTIENCVRTIEEAIQCA